MRKHTRLGVEQEFFHELREGSRVKQEIVTNYFIAYNNVMARPPRPKVGYADLFAGPGRYRGGSGEFRKSIPLLVTEATIREERFRQTVHLWFNEGDPANYEALKTAMGEIPGCETLWNQPRIDNRIVDSTWVTKLQKLRTPTLVFLDPCGYKGLSLKLVQSVLSGFGNDCIFFFNYSRINMKLSLEIMNKSIDEFFETHRAQAIRANIANCSPERREEIILDAVKSSIAEAGGIPLVFRFKSENGRISHHLVFASKSQKAADMMKVILSRASSVIKEGVGTGEHDPRATEKPPSLFAGLYEVEERVLRVYAGREIMLGNLLQLEGNTQFTESNYRDAILNLELSRIIRPSGRRATFRTTAIPKGRHEANSSQRSDHSVLE